MEIFAYSPFDNFDSQDALAPQTDSIKDSKQKNKKSFQCSFPQCGKVFKFKSELSRHEVIHFNTRPFTCPHANCGKTFKREDALDTHLRLHTKEMPFQCEFPGCDKTFTTKAAQKYHFLKHNNERAHKCTCGKAFFTKGQLKQHEKAFNYHLGKDATKAKEVPVTNVSSCVDDDDEFYKHFYAPSTPRIVQNIEWEIKNQEDECAAFDINEDEKVVEYIPDGTKDLTEKQELVNVNFQDEEEGFFSLNTNWLEPVREPCLFYDENEFKFLDFLQEQSYDKY